LTMHFRYFGYTFIKLPNKMIIKINKYMDIFRTFFTKDLYYKQQTSLDVTNCGGYGGWYDQGSREIFHVSPIMLGCTPPWPAGDLKFQKNAIKLFSTFNYITKTCLHAVAIGINVDPTLLLGLCETEWKQPLRMGSSYRVCKYTKKEDSVGSICAEHTDTTLLSVCEYNKLRIGFISLS